MTKADEVEATLTQLLDAVKGDRDKEATQTLIILVGGVVIDLARIADAVEKLTTFNLTRVGDIVVSKFGEDLSEGIHAVLTPEEATMIDALRRGDIVVNQPPSAVSEPDEPEWLDWDGQKSNPPDLEPYDVVEVGFVNSLAIVKGAANTFGWLWRREGDMIDRYRLIAKYVETDADVVAVEPATPATLGDFGEDGFLKRS